MTEQIYDVREAAEFLGVSVQYLYQMKHNGEGPVCKKVALQGVSGPGPRMRNAYTKTALVEWDAARRTKKTTPRKKASAKPPKRKKASASSLNHTF